jgi:hypothetical protein
MTATIATNAERAELARDNLIGAVNRFRESGEFELVHPARWRHLATGHHVETGFSYGEGILCVFLDGGRKADRRFVLSGREDDLTEFNELFPVSSS